MPRQEAARLAIPADRAKARDAGELNWRVERAAHFIDTVNVALT
jgi:hypothetical protein